MAATEPSPEIINAELAEPPDDRASGDRASGDRASDNGASDNGASDNGASDNGASDNEPFGVPRRFGIGTILVVTTAFAILLSLLQYWGAPPVVVWFVIAFVSLVGLGQMLLFGGKQPRKASIVMGALGLPLMMAAAVAMFKPSPTLPGEMAWVVFNSLIFGALFGYLAGGVVAGVFLIMDAVEQTLADLRRRKSG